MSDQQDTRPEKRKARKAQKDAVQTAELAELRAREEREYREQQLVKLGRPSSYTPEQADELCAWLASGKSAKSWCRHSGVALVTVYRWLREHDDFRARYARAHDDRADTLADELVDLADSVANGTMEEIVAAKLRIDTRKWIAAKLRPQRWGEHQPERSSTNVTFNIGISRLPHTAGTTIDATPLIQQGSAPGSHAG